MAIPDRRRTPGRFGGPLGTVSTLALLITVIGLGGCTDTAPSAKAASSDAKAAVPAASTTAPSVAAAPTPAAPDPTAPGPPGSGIASGKPYVVIRFTESSVDYEKPLAAAVQRAVARRPNVAFDLVAVTPRAKDADDLVESTNRAREQAAAVLKSLSSMGISADRVNMATWTGQPTDVNEIRLYIR